MLRRPHNKFVVKYQYVTNCRNNTEHPTAPTSVAATRDCYGKRGHAVLQLFFPIPPKGLRGRGYRRDPFGEARDGTLHRDGGSTLSYSRAVVLEDLQIAN